MSTRCVRTIFIATDKMIYLYCISSTSILYFFICPFNIIQSQFKTLVLVIYRVLRPHIHINARADIIRCCTYYRKRESIVNYTLYTLPDVRHLK